MDKNFWNERYGNAEYAYGEAPNSYFREKLKDLSPGSILMPADGEGRNGVHAARHQWKVLSFDLSDKGRDKAFRLAHGYGVTLDYMVGDCLELSLPENHFDCIGLIYAHFPASIKSACHQKLNRSLKPGGHVIFEAYSKNHLSYQARFPRIGGPKDIDQLFDLDEVRQDFSGFEFQELAECEVALEEGAFHQGLGSVIRFVARKPDTPVGHQ
ncbi:MAG: class I SAM-dependent methyltransferase [Cyclobacteriaceae bacterium]|nr:class I SAM-dependent methyltransferase [Cyclobacteriaceae bacterium]